MSSPVRHTHPPVTGLVEDCDYCKLYGNVFLNGPMKVDESKLQPYMISFRNQNPQPKSDIDTNTVS